MVELGGILEKYPFTQDFFEQNRLKISGSESLTFPEFLTRLSDEEIEDSAIRIETLPGELSLYIDQMKEFLGIEREAAVGSLSILAGRDKNRQPETFGKIDIYPSQIVSIVGPTGSGKSRLLADIEWAAQRDTPTGRMILINGEKPDPKWRYSTTHKLVAQLSQNMNFIIDLNTSKIGRASCRERV